MDTDTPEYRCSVNGRAQYAHYTLWMNPLDRWTDKCARTYILAVRVNKAYLHNKVQSGKPMVINKLSYIIIIL